MHASVHASVHVSVCASAHAFAPTLKPIWQRLTAFRQCPRSSVVAHKLFDSTGSSEEYRTRLLIDKIDAYTNAPHLAYLDS